MAWRAADSLAIRSFLGLGLDERAPDHSTISRTRRLIDLQTHREVFGWIQERLARAGLLGGKTIAVDATTLEANAAMRSIVRRDTGETYQEFLTRLAKASGIRTPSRQALARLDRRRKKKGSNEEWASPVDPDAKITKMKDGRTHLAHKAEQAVDMATGAIVAITIQGADQGDTTTIKKTPRKPRIRSRVFRRGPALVIPGVCRKSSRTRATTPRPLSRSWKPRGCARTCPNPIGVAGDGEVTLTAATWSTRTVGAAAELEASACIVSGGNEPSDPSLTSTEQDA
jgi:IS5 family transposase